jgi:hypothetical protein
LISDLQKRLRRTAWHDSCRDEPQNRFDRLLDLRPARCYFGNVKEVTPLMLSDMTAAVDGCSTLTLSGNLTRPM